jgi:hypothetical protein
MSPDARSWTEHNQRYLATALATLRTVLGEPDLTGHAIADTPEAVASAMPAPPALESVRRTFGLSGFERDLLLLCAGVELDGGFAAAVARAGGETGPGVPTFSLALARLAEPHWSAITPAGPLRHWQLIDLVERDSLMGSPLRIDERVLHHLTGVQYIDDRLEGLVEVVLPEAVLSPTHERVVERIERAWSSGGRGAKLPLIQLVGRDALGARRIAATAAGRLGLQAVALLAESITSPTASRGKLVRLWEREAALGSLLLVVDTSGLEAADQGVSRQLRDVLEQVASPLVVIATRPVLLPGRPSIQLPVQSPDRAERRALWRAALQGIDARQDGALIRVADQFVLDPAQILETAAELGLRASGAEPDDLDEALWDLCRLRTRTRFDGLAQRIEPAAEWSDLVLPEAQRRTLGDIAVHVRQRGRVYDDWGFAAKGRRGLGISALFAGPSGTGKTMAAEVLARELRLDLYRIDLSQVVSKYIGETEKNLGRLFDAAEGGGAILLFDEADALFGKRSEVRDSHDRYANIEVSYLLQRMETYDGLAILTTNLKNALDQAFLRRIRFVIQFPFPDAVARKQIWAGIFPASTPTEGLLVDKLARLNLAGGNIRNIALNAAFLAAEADDPVRMSHLFQAARAEATKLERPLADAEIRGWVTGSPAAQVAT